MLARLWEAAALGVRVGWVKQEMMQVRLKVLRAIWCHLLPINRVMCSSYSCRDLRRGAATSVQLQWYHNSPFRFRFSP